MAESQLMCMEDGHIPANVPESKPEFYYSEEQRAALEQLLMNGDGAFKMRLMEDKAKDFLSAREIKSILNTFKVYVPKESDDNSPDNTSDNTPPAAAVPRAKATSAPADSGVHSTYWPKLSDTEVPPLDIGWHNGGIFKGVTRVTVHTHPPKDNGPHIKEVVRRLIQESSKVVAIVMDLLTDLHILQDLMEAASRRSVAVYIVLDAHGVPHFLDMCCRLQMGSQHLKTIRARSLQGTGFNLSFGKLPGSLCNKYMLVDGDKVMFGSYSFSWCSWRMDRNMITVMTGQVVDVYDRDFRELYAVSDELDLYTELHVSAPPAHPPTLRPQASSKRPPLPATTSRFQVALGDSDNKPALFQVPAHKYHNPKYLLALGGLPGPLGAPEALGLPSGDVGGREAAEGGGEGSGEWGEPDQLSPLPSDADAATEGSKTRSPNGELPGKKKKPSLKERLLRGSRKSSAGRESGGSPSPTTMETSGAAEDDTVEEEEPVVVVKKPSRWRSWKTSSKQGPERGSVQSVGATRDDESVKSQKRHRAGCAQS